MTFTQSCENEQTNKAKRERERGKERNREIEKEKERERERARKKTCESEKDLKGIEREKKLSWKRNKQR